MGETTTTWNLKLKENVLGTFQKLKAAATAVQDKVKSYNTALKKASRSGVEMGGTLRRSYSQLEGVLKGLEKRQKEAFSTKNILGYQKLIDKTRAEMVKLNAVTHPPSSGWAKMQEEMSANMPGLSRGLSLLKSPLALIAGASLLVGVGLHKATDLALDFNEGIAKVNATAQLGDQSLGQLKNRLKEIGGNSGGNFERIPEAYEKILSQTNKVNLSLDILQVAVKGAKAGFTDIDTVAGALARTLSIVGEKNTSAAQVMDTLFAAKKYGAGEFKDFAQYLPQLIADAKVLGINFKDTAGIFAFMTAKGQSATDATMLMKNAFTAMNKLPILKEMEKTGIKIFDAKGMRRNISDILGDFTKKWQSLSDKGRAIFLSNIKLHDAQALTAFSVLTSDADKFKEIMGGVNNSLGETNRQLAMTGNYKRTWGDIGDDIKNMGESIGTYLLPVVDAFVQAFSQIPNVVRDVSSVLTLGLVSSVDKVAREKMEIEKNRKDLALKASMDVAGSMFKEKYGFAVDDNKHKFSKTEIAFYDHVQKDMLKKFLGATDKNNIDKNEQTNAEKALNNVNKGQPVNGSGSSDQSASIHGDGDRARSLIMNLKIYNSNTINSEMDVKKIHQLIEDAIVDAARDGLVTIGA